MYLSNTIDDEELIKKIQLKLTINYIPFLILFLGFVAFLIFGNGYKVSPETGEVSLVPHHYLHSLLSNIITLVIFISGVVLVLYSFYAGTIKKSRKAIWFAGPGTVMVVMALFFLAGYGETSFYPSYSDMQSSLTLANASSSLFTLKTMLYVSFIIPFVVLYIWYAWKSINRKKITAEEMSEGGHLY